MIHCPSLEIAGNNYSATPDDPSSTTTFPDLSRSPNWYDLKTYHSPNNLLEPLTYEAHNQAVKQAHKSTGIATTKVTHAMRGGAARMADLGGASESDIARQGRWANSSLTNHYLTSLPRPALRALGGWRPNGGDFYLPRAVDPPNELVELVFPQASIW